MTQANVLAQIGATSGPTFRNRIINGAMILDQRNAGASVTQTTGNLFTVDRFYVTGSVTTKFTAQRNAGSVTPPVGFINYLGCTSSSAYSVAAGDYFVVQQSIEGLNCTDLSWGTASAQTVTLSFWVRSSLTGTFGGSLRNSANNRSYPFSYTISAATTWEYKTITIAGDTSGTWLTSTGIGINLTFSLGTGSTFSGTAGAWAGSNFLSATGATSVVGTNGATLYITGVQLERGTQATGYEYENYTSLLAKCQRYFYKTYDIATTPGTVTGIGAIGTAINGIGYAQLPIYYPVNLRTDPTVTFYNASSGATGTWRDGGATDRTMTINGGATSSYIYNYTSAANSLITGHLTASAEL
jgi:hypothetical protein